ncbi:unnamed protein product [Durusdinium trenchii]|uniref:Uncharacterized protein n=1 Tax=Durusdinium trenchii TaxID=1381693 RepID=A0ABP0QXV3_9DINO
MAQRVLSLAPGSTKDHGREQLHRTWHGSSLCGRITHSLGSTVQHQERRGSKFRGKQRWAQGLWRRWHFEVLFGRLSWIESGSHHSTCAFLGFHGNSVLIAHPGQVQKWIR